jgi:hypothetical protein
MYRCLSVSTLRDGIPYGGRKVEVLPPTDDLRDCASTHAITVARIVTRNAAEYMPENDNTTDDGEHGRWLGEALLGAKPVLGSVVWTALVGCRGARAGACARGRPVRVDRQAAVPTVLGRTAPRARACSQDRLLHPANPMYHRRSLAAARNASVPDQYFRPGDDRMRRIVHPAEVNRSTRLGAHYSPATRVTCIIIKMAPKQTSPVARNVLYA